MIVPDANLLIYAVDETSPLHDRAKEWIENCLSGTETIAFAWVVLLAFLRVTTRPGVFAHPLTVGEALEVMDCWLAEPAAQVVSPTERHAALLREMLEHVGTGGNFTADAHLAALAMEHGATLATADRDFGRFPRLRVSYPLSGT